MASEAAHIANMTSQLREVLRDVRIEAAKYNKDVATNLKKCPECGEIWSKIEGCDGATTCGNRPYEQRNDNWSKEMSAFSFTWDSAKEKLSISKLGQKRRVRTAASKKLKVAGCGRTIEWSKMQPVTDIPFQYDSVPSTKDLQPLPSPADRAWNKNFDNAMHKLKTLKINKIGRASCRERV